MGHAISRTKPSIVTLDLFARSLSIDVFCGGWGAAIIDATPHPAKKQKRKMRFIRPSFSSRLDHWYQRNERRQRTHSWPIVVEAYSDAHCCVVQISENSW